ncbi:MAG: ATPase with chaperone activity [Burkholderiaceae bacterium]
MTEENQFIIAPSFIALYVPAGRIKPTASRDEIAARYEFCEDLANLLTEQAATTRWQLGITERDVLERIRAGLDGDDAPVSSAEADWIVRRLAELLDWPPL